MKLNKYISVTDYLQNRSKLEDLPDEVVANINTLIPKINELLEQFGEHRACNSGYRRPEDQIRIYREKGIEIDKIPMGSAHLVGLAIDLEDKNAKLYNWLRANEALLIKLDLYCEERQGGWQHLQARKPKSGKRWFNP